MQKGILIARGRTAEVYEWGDDEILKLFYDWVPEEWVNREALNASQIAKTDISVPAYRGRVDEDQRKGILFQRLYGQTYLSILSKKIFFISKYAKQMAQIHTAILHHQDSSFVSLHERLNSSIQGVSGLPDDLRNFCLDTLNSLPDGNQICHFDFHPDQIMQTEHGDYVIDWSTAFRGDPCADIARTTYLLTMSGIGHLPRLLQVLVRFMRKIMYRFYMAEMQRLNPTFDFASVEKWIIPIAAARLMEKIEEENPSILSFLEKAYSKFQQ